MRPEKRIWNPVYRGVDPDAPVDPTDKEAGPKKIKFYRQDGFVDSTNPGLGSTVLHLLTLTLVEAGFGSPEISSILGESRSTIGDRMYELRGFNKDPNGRLFEKVKYLGLDNPMALVGLTEKLIDPQKRASLLKQIDAATKTLNDNTLARTGRGPFGVFPPTELDMENEESWRSVLIKQRGEKQRRTMEGLTEAIKAYTAEFAGGKLVGTAYTDQAENLYRFFKRLEEQKLTREERQDNHFCVYFAAFDPQNREVFIGHHIKSGLWLFNGGHIDFGETPREAALREISEELGVTDYQLPSLPSLLTITDINNGKVKCKTHWDIWYFLPFDKNSFSPDVDKLRTEFYENRWCPIDSAQNLITDPSNLKAIEALKGL